MALRKIVVEGDPILRKKARAIDEVGLKEREIFLDMLDTMREADGVGLAAPQVGLLKQMIIVEVSDPLDIEKAEEEGREPSKLLYFLANPKIVESEGCQQGIEGCLSVPGLVGTVERPMIIKVEALDYHGEPLSFTAEGFLAVAISHEMDHLKGVLFTDKATDVKEEEYENSVHGDS